MIFGIGVDLCDRRRITQAIERHGERFEQRLCNYAELARINGARDRAMSLSKAFAAKEAVAKAMGTGIRGFAFKDIEIARDALGKPIVILHPAALATLRARIGGDCAFRIHLSLSDEGDTAIAYAILETHDKDFT
jgi:holo-[acyl-carrier protein] synthase